jgi:adenine deaminase
MIDPDLLAVARGDRPADLLLRNGRVVNVFTGEIEPADIAIFGGRVAGIGPGYFAHETIDLAGSFVAPGLIDAHVHIESSLCIPSEFAAAVLPRGVTTVITDPHEIANVAGIAGVRFMADARRGVPLHIEIMAPSCVPATDMGTAGAVLSADDLASLLNDGTVGGLAEVMNFPAVISGDPAMRAKLDHFTDRAIDGHCPGLRGRHLNAYIAAGIGSDHESVTAEEAREKLARGLVLLIREATNARNLDALLPLITAKNCRRICFCTDDRQPADLLTTGGIDDMVRRAIAYGIDPVDAIRMATLNTAEYFRLSDRGAIAPGKAADLFVFDDLAKPSARLVFVAGKSVAEYKPPVCLINTAVIDTCRLDVAAIDLRIATPSPGTRREGRGEGDFGNQITSAEQNHPHPSPFADYRASEPKSIRVIRLLPDQLVTHQDIVTPKILNGEVISDPSSDVLKIAVIERHRRCGNTGLGFVRGVGLKSGAIAGTIAHDHHNLIAIGVDDESMRAAIAAATASGGGLAVASGTSVLAHLPLPIAGLMSDRPIAEVREAYDRLLAATVSLGSTLHDPFMAMSFVALEVIPSLKITDQGLIDVDRFCRVGLFVDDESVKPAI